MGFQPFIGFIHHRQYQKAQHRGLLSYIHIWYGRILMLLGVINGGLGLQLVGTSGSMRTVYIAMASIFGAIYIIGVIINVITIKRGLRV